RTAGGHGGPGALRGARVLRRDHRRRPQAFRAGVLVHGQRLDRPEGDRGGLVVERSRPRRPVPVGNVLLPPYRGLRRPVRDRHHVYGLGRVDGVSRELAHVSDTFTFIAPVMPRRRADPFAVKLAASGLVLIVLISGFATFVVAQERAADARHAALEARTRAEASATADRLAVTPVPAVADDPV